MDRFIRSASLEKYKIEIVKRFAGGGRLLEIGPAYGTFGWLAKQAGFEVEAIEMEAACCRFLTEKLRVKAIHDSDIVHALEACPSYDVIALWHVIEHLPDPWKIMDAISKKTITGGIVVIATPNPDAWQFKVQKKFWPHVDAPRHLMLIPPELLAKRMNDLGFKTVLMTTRDQGSLGWNTFGWQYFFANMSSFRPFRILLRLAGHAISIILSPLERPEGKGSTYTAVFKKE